MSEPTQTTTTGCCPLLAANIVAVMPSFTSWANREHPQRQRAASGGLFLRPLQLAVLCAIGLLLLSGCSSNAPETKSEPAPPPKPAEPVVPDEIQSAAQSLLGTETTVLVFGDLAKTGRQQFLAANVVPKSTRNQLPGTIITRAVVGENEDGQWKEIFRCDEHLKNSKGFLAGTPMADVTGWRIAYEQNPEKGLQLYLTPLKGGNDDPHSLPIGVRWNPKAKRYQSLDRTYENFLTESANLSGGTPKSTLR